MDNSFETDEKGNVAKMNGTDEIVWSSKSSPITGKLQTNFVCKNTSKSERKALRR